LQICEREAGQAARAQVCYNRRMMTPWEVLQQQTREAEEMNRQRVAAGLPLIPIVRAPKPQTQL